MRTAEPTIRAALRYGRERIDPFDVRLLLEGILGVSSSYLVAYDDERLSEAQWSQFTDYVNKNQDGMPIPYLLGRAPFAGRDFIVSPAVLIPRPETEQLVEIVLSWLVHHPAVTRIVDVGTGSGCIPITLACELDTISHKATVQAVDVSAAALAIARQNAVQHRAAVAYWQGDLLTAANGHCDVIAANLPYIRDDEWTQLPVGVKSYEPSLALRGGADGLDLIRALLRQTIENRLQPSLIVLEIGWRQGPSAEKLARSFYPSAVVEIVQDYAGHDRFIRIENDF